VGLQVVPQRAGLLLVAALQPPLLAETKRKELVRARLAPEGPAFLLELEAASAVIRRLIPGRVVLPATSALAPAPEARAVVRRAEVRAEAPAEEVEEEVVAAVTLEALPAVASLLEAVAAVEARLAAEDQLQLEVQLVCL
jgi:hypothetical protein